MNNVPHCSFCGVALSPGAQFCPQCGTPAELRHATATGRLPPNTLLHDRYLVTSKLAQGGQSAVYRALDTLDSGAERAIKEMSESDLTYEERVKAINSLMREATMLQQLSHPALTQVHELFVEGPRHYLVMEYVNGHTLEDEMMMLGRALEWERVGPWGMALCDVLSYLHSRQPPVIYRDLKPPNVMMASENGIKLIDFGIARWLHPERMQDTAQLGTDGYAPPEQYNARSEPRSDLYALGATLYHLLTGRVPESAPQRLAGRKLTPVHSYNSRVPEAAERVVLQALSLQADDRYPNADAFRAAIAATFGEQASSGNRYATAAPASTASIPSATSATSTAKTASATERAAAPMGSPTAMRATPTQRGSLNVITGPRLRISPLRADLGMINPGESPVVTLAVENRGAGALDGHVEVNHDCLKPKEKNVSGATSAVQIRVDTTKLRPGPYVCHVAVRTNGGDQIVPVRFTLRAQVG